MMQRLGHPASFAALVAVLAVPVAADPLPILEETAKLLAPDGDEEDSFGVSSAVSGDTAAVGAYYGEDGEGVETGAVYIFERDAGGPGNWGAVAKLLHPDGERADQFGISLALEGDTLVVGADEDWAPLQESGSAWVFERDEEGTWRLVTRLVAADQDTSEKFGYSVALDGDTLLVGAHRDKEIVLGGGAAYVFERNAGGPGAWGQVAKLVSSTPGVFDEFGISVAVSGDTVVVGELWDSEAGYNAGAAHVFERDLGGADAWGHVVKLTGARGGRAFGSAVGIAGDTVMVAEGGYYDAGETFVFERNFGGQDAWGRVARLSAPDGEVADSFGGPLGIGSHRAVIAASGDERQGSAYLFQKRSPGGGWVFVAKMQASDRDDGDARFAGSGGLDGETAVFGSTGDQDLGIRSGSAYIFSLEDCVLDLRLATGEVRAGGELRLGLHLEHNRGLTVTVPLLFWVEDASGMVVARHRTRPITFRHGDVVDREVRVALPAEMAPGRYRLVAGVEGMQQRVAWAVRPFEVVRGGAGGK